MLFNDDRAVFQPSLGYVHVVTVPGPTRLKVHRPEEGARRESRQLFYLLGKTTEPDLNAHSQGRMALFVDICQRTVTDTSIMGYEVFLVRLEFKALKKQIL